MKKIVLFFMMLGIVFGSEVKVAVAANVSYALDELISAFNKLHPDIKIVPILSSSGNLTAQIRNNAPYEVFLSANMKYPNNLFKLGYGILKPVVYAKGKLALVSKKIQNLSDLNILTTKNIKSIAIANPDVAPYGMASVEALKNSKIYKEVKNKFVYAQTISQTLTYTLNVASVGFIASSALHSPKLKKRKLFYANVDKNLYTPINQGIILLLKGAKNKGAKDFYDFILSKEAKKIFQKYGYDE